MMATGLTLRRPDGGAAPPLCAVAVRCRGSGRGSRMRDKRGEPMIESRETPPLSDWRFAVHDANLVFGANCPNIDLIVYGKQGAVYAQIKATTKAAGKVCLVIDGSPWTEPQLRRGAPIFNKHDHFRASLVILVDASLAAEPQFYVAPPHELEQLVRERGVALADRPKRDGKRRAITFRKELPRAVLAPWRDAWAQLGEPLVASGRGG